MKEYKLPPVWYYFVLIAFVGLVVVLALTTSVRTAVIVLAGGFLAHGVARGALPAGTVPEVRSVPFDITSCVIAAALLVYLSSWGNTPQL